MPAVNDCPKVFVSAGEASGDMYAAWTVAALKQRLPGAQYFGCAGPRLRAAGCEALLEAESIAVVGLAEVVSEVPRVWRAYRSLLKQALDRRPDLAILVDAPDFNLRLARHFRRHGVPVLYVVAPQVWAWRPWRVRQIRRVVDRLACIFPFEEAWFRERGVNAEYVGHPLSGRVAPQLSRSEFFEWHGLDPSRPLVALLPGSRRREVALNLPPMLEAAGRLDAQCVIAVPHDLPLPPTEPRLKSAAADEKERFRAGEGAAPVRNRAGDIRVVRGLTYDAVAHADAALVASGTATIETALLGTPMVVVYRVTEPTWRFGRLLVRTRFYSMVNLVAERQVVPELIQGAFTAGRAAAEISRLLEDGEARASMKRALAEVAAKLGTVADPMGRIAGHAVEMLGARSSATKVP